MPPTRGSAIYFEKHPRLTPRAIGYRPRGLILDFEPPASLFYLAEFQVKSYPLGSFRSLMNLRYVQYPAFQCSTTVFFDAKDAEAQRNAKDVLDDWVEPFWKKVTPQTPPPTSFAPRKLSEVDGVQKLLSSALRLLDNLFSEKREFSRPFQKSL